MTQQKMIRVENMTQGTIVATGGRVADNFWLRFKGLMGVGSLDEGEGLHILPCKSIHTHFMKIPIDVIYLDQSFRVVALDRDLKPWRFGRIYRHANSVLELPVGTIEATATIEGDQIAIKNM